MGSDSEAAVGISGGSPAAGDHRRPSAIVEFQGPSLPQPPLPRLFLNGGIALAQTPSGRTYERKPVSRSEPPLHPGLFSAAVGIVGLMSGIGGQIVNLPRLVPSSSWPGGSA